MRQELSVDKAINIGHLSVNIPVFVSMFGIPVLGNYLSTNKIIPIWGFGFSFLVGFVLAWFLWSVMITKWRIWAFKNVRNVHELKKRAIQEKLIWKDGSVFEKTEIRTKQDRKLLLNLEKKFEKEDFYREDFSVPPKTKIYYSKSTIYIEISISLLIIAVGFYIFTFAENKYYILGTILNGIGIYTIIKELRKTSTKEAQITINNKGIKTINVEFKEWQEISDEQIVQEGYGKSLKSFLIYCYDSEEYEKIEIEPLNITPKMLENILRTYRIRHSKNYS